MDFMNVLDLITGIGFPAFATLLMYKMNKDIQETDREDRNNLIEVVSHNTTVIETFKERLDVIIELNKEET